MDMYITSLPLNRPGHLVNNCKMAYSVLFKERCWSFFKPMYFI